MSGQDPPIVSVIDKRVAEVARLEEGEGDGYWTGYLDALAFVRKSVPSCKHVNGLVERPVCEDCGTAFP